jgi:hypothetical protein
MTRPHGDPDEYVRDMTADERRTRTPDTWGGAVAIGGDVYLRRDPDEQGAEALWFFHWCPTRERWACAGAAKHDLVAEEPLHLEPSLLWPCCGKHGWIRNGAWTDA